MSESPEAIEVDATSRWLEPVGLEHAAAMQPLLADPDVAHGYGLIHPCSTGSAKRWIRGSLALRDCGVEHAFAIIGAAVGLVGMARLSQLDGDAPRLSYWVGRPHWRRGYASFAARALVRHGFEVLELPRIEAYCRPDNIGSLEVLRAAGFTRVERCDSLLRHIQEGQAWR